MNRYFRLLALTMLAAAPAAMAVPARPGITTVTQADGSTLDVQIRGDERHHFYLSEDGYLLANKQDIYYYADVDANGSVLPSTIRATRPALRDGVARQYLQQMDMTRVFSTLHSAAESTSGTFAKAPRRGPGLFEGNSFPAHGHQKAIVILVEYTDVKMRLDNPIEYFTNMLCQPGFSEYGGTGSATDYFLESSNGMFQPEFDVFGPVTLAHNMSYYGGNDWWGDDERPEEMIIEACQLLDDTVDFSEYDRDGDGYIDNVFVFYAGQGEASGGSSNTVWPHSWDIEEATYTPYYFDGVRLNRYACSNEWESGRPDGVGTFIHEFSHVLGLPDLYATSYTSAFTPGAWSVLDYGPYNNDGCTPPLYSAFERYALGWGEPVEIDGPMNATLPSIGSNIFGIIKTSKDNEYFLFENRQQESWDTYIPGHGMLVWHVDYNSSVWTSNTVNNSASHQYVDIEEADGTQSEYTRDGDAFPGASGKTTFTSTTKPALKTWSGQAIDLPITDIAETDGLITFKVAGGRELDIQPVTALEPDDVTNTSFVAAWTSAGPEATYLLSVYTRPEGSDAPVYLPGLLNRSLSGVTTFAVEGLEPVTEYYYTVSVGSGLEHSAPSNEMAVFTGRLPLDRRAVTANEADDVTTDGFTATWEALDDADSYLLNVYTKQFGEPIEDICNFDDGVSALPEGWTTNTRSSYANTAYSGEAAPSLRLSNSGDYIQTPEYADMARSITFWHRGNATSDDDCLRVSARVNGKWQKVADLPVTTTKGGAIHTVGTDLVPGDAIALRVEYLRTGTKGSVAIDDVVAGHGTTFTAIPVDGYTDYPAGSATECAVTGLNPDTDYFYTVSALSADGELRSRPSNEIAVRTKTATGIIEIDADAGAPVEYYNLQGIRVQHPRPGGLYIRRQGDKTDKVRF